MMESRTHLATPLHLPWRLHRFLPAMILILLASALYLRTLTPDLIPGDSAEFQTLAYTLGMSHPTGHPIYILLLHLFCRLPLGELAWRANLFSSLMSVVTLVLLYACVLQMDGTPAAAFAAATAFGISQVYWSQSVVAEAYTPASAVITGILLLLFLWKRRNRRRVLAGCGLLFGLSGGVHAMIMLTAPGILVFLLLSRARIRDYLTFAAGVAVGLSVYLGAFFLVDLHDPPSSYFNAVMLRGTATSEVEPAQLEGPLRRFLFWLFSRHFRVHMGAASFEQLGENGGLYLRTTVSSFSLPFLLILPVGVFTAMSRHNRPRSVLILLAWAAQLIFVVNFNPIDIVVFYIPTWIYLSLLSGMGASLLQQRVSGLTDRNQRLRKWRTAIAGVIGALLILAVVAPRWELLQAAWREERLAFLDGTEWEGYPYTAGAPHAYADDALSVVSNLEDDAILFTDWNRVYPYLFAAHVLQKRTGVRIFETPIVHEFRGGKYHRAIEAAILEYIDSRLGKCPIYFDTFEPSLEAAISRRYTWQRSPETGGVYRLTGRR